MFELLLIIYAAGTYYQCATPETGILVFEDFHTSGCMADKEDCHIYMEAYHTCLCYNYRP